MTLAASRAVYSSNLALWIDWDQTESEFIRFSPVCLVTGNRQGTFSVLVTQTWSSRCEWRRQMSPHQHCARPNRHYNWGHLKSASGARRGADCGERGPVVQCDRLRGNGMWTCAWRESRLLPGREKEKHFTWRRSGSSGKCDSVTTVPGLGGPGVSHLPGAEAFASTCSYERTLKDI